jgi:hypothetical protein
MILFLDLMLLIVAVLILLAFVTQIVIPAKNGTPMFPFFRTSETAVAVQIAEEELAHIAEMEHLDELQEEINRRKAQLKKDE